RFSPAPQRSAGMNVEVRQALEQRAVDRLGEEETAAAVKLHRLARQQAVPAALAQPRRQHLVEEKAARRGKIDAAARTIDGASDVVAARPETLRPEVIRHARARDAFATFVEIAAIHYRAQREHKAVGAMRAAPQLAAMGVHCQ